jgi:predicted transcriptional regulator
MSIGLATKTIINMLLKARNFCLPEKELRETLTKQLGYSESSAYVYIHKLNRKGVITKKRTNKAIQICLEIEKLRDLGLAVILLV